MRSFFAHLKFRLQRKLKLHLFGKGHNARGGVYWYEDMIPPTDLSLIHAVKDFPGMLVTDLEAYNILQAARRMNGIAGHYAEVGTYKGGSAKLICGATEKPVHLFDTFEGLPALHDKDNPHFLEGQYAATLDDVRSAVNAPNAFFYKGLFPASAPANLTAQFAFVHLDVDLYQSTLDSLAYFYPRMNKGAVLISHDYGGGGVQVAFDEFFADKPEMVIPLALTTQAMVIKL